MIFNPSVGCFYKIEFDDMFHGYDGIYEIVEIYSYARMLETGGSLRKACEGVKKTIRDLDPIMDDIRNGHIIKIRGVVDGLMFDIHKSAMKSLDSSIKQVNANVALIVELGPYEDMDMLSFLTDKVGDIVKNDLGITDKSPILYSKDKTYMTSSEYDKIVSQRNANKGDTNTYKQLYEQKIAECEALKTKIAALNSIIVQRG